MITKATVLLLTITIILGITIAPAAANDCESADCAIDATAISAYPAPNVEQLYAPENLLTDRSYQRVTEAVEILNAPGGAPVRTLDAGFNFVTAGASQDGWTLINQEQWVRSEALRGTRPSSFAGVRIVDADLPYPFAWMLLNTVPSRQPGAEPTAGDLAILRYTLVNLYTTVTVDDWEWYQVGVDQWIEQRQVARYLPIDRPADVDTNRWVSVDLYEQIIIAYEDETPVFATLVASGLSEWATNEGLFHVYVRYPRTVMSGARGQPDFYYLEEVPWTMYFDGDIGLHGTYWHDRFGYRASHGCVNLSIADAYWLYDWSSAEIDLTVPNDTGAAVYVYSSGEYR